MLIIGLVLSVFGIGFCCWVLFILAVYALPCLTAGMAAYHSGAGVAGAFIVAIIAGGFTLTIGRHSLDTERGHTA